MKKCQCCGVDAAPDAPSCASCGEASWLVLEPAPQDAPTKPSLRPGKKGGSS